MENSTLASQEEGLFLTDLKEIRRRAHGHIQDGPGANSCKQNPEVVPRLLNEALATVLVCILRYRRHYYMAQNVHSEAVAAEFLKHAREMQDNADRIAERIVQLGGEPNFDPEGMLTRSRSECLEGETLVDMVREDLLAQQIAIESYSKIIRYLAHNDPTSRSMMESLLAKEQAHANDMNPLLETIEEEARWSKRTRLIFGDHRQLVQSERSSS